MLQCNVLTSEPCIYLFWLKVLIRALTLACESSDLRVASEKNEVCSAFSLLHCGPYGSIHKTYTALQLGAAPGKGDTFTCLFPIWRSKSVEVKNHC